VVLEQAAYVQVVMNFAWVMAVMASCAWVQVQNYSSVSFLLFPFNQHNNR
jgi:hypothetical protein